MTYSKIAGTGSYLPEKILSNADLEKMVDTTDDWIMERTGIRNRHIAASGDTASSMATQASRRALAAAGLTKDDIGLIVVATTTGDQLIPSTACLLQEQLGIKDCPAFDVAAACAGFSYALTVADQFIRAGTIKHALVVGTEVMSRLVDWKDRSTCILFGDGAGVVVLSASEEPGILSSHLHADGSYKHLLHAPNTMQILAGEVENPYMQIKGNEVFKVAVISLGNLITETLAANGLEPSAIDWLIPHQANLRIIAAMAKRLNLPMERVVMTIEHQGNTSAASVPLALDHAVRDGRIKRGETLLLESFGGGFAWGSTLIVY